MNAALIAESLEVVVARCGDPAPIVYARLFAAQPDVEALFVRDKSGIVSGQMLAVTIEALLDYAGDNAYAANLLQSERVNHDGLGVPLAAFDSFFHILLETMRELAGEEWTPAMDAAWRNSIAGLTAASA